MDQCISFYPAVRRAMEHVFARKLLARSVDVASTWSARSGMVAITLDGDLCSRKGALTGGFVDVEKSRLRAHHALRGAQGRLRELDGEHRELKERSAEVDRQVSEVMGEVQKLEAKHANLDHVMGRIEDDVKKMEKSRQRHEKQAKQVEEDLPPVEAQIASLRMQIERLEEEVGTELSSKLSQEDRDLLDGLKASQTRLDSNIEEHTQVLEEATIKRQRLTSLLEDNLVVRRNELSESTSSNSRSCRQSAGKSAATAASQTQMKVQLDQSRRELEEAASTAEDVEKQLLEVKKIDESLRAEILKIKNNFDKLKTQDANNQKELEESHEYQERLLNKRSMCIQKA